LPDTEVWLCSTGTGTKDKTQNTAKRKYHGITPIIPRLS
jgi:hypothetical protein